MKTEPTEEMREKIEQLFDFTDADKAQIDMFQKIKYEIAITAFKKGQSSPKIKQLEWEEYRDCLVSTTPFYNVSIKEVCGIYELATAYSAFIKSYNSLDEAKAAAQADFEKRIKECLS